jgi:Flp pilus assembly protein TadG
MQLMKRFSRILCTTKIIRVFARGTMGNVAIEFAIIVPVLAMMFLALYEVWNMVSTSRQIQTVANSISQIIAQQPAAIPLAAADLSFATDSTMVLFPGVLADSHQKGISWSSDIAVTISSVVFTPQPTGCAAAKPPNCTGYSANVAWTRSTDATKKRPCGLPSGQALTSAPSTATPTPSTLPSDAFPLLQDAASPGSLIVADVVYTYTPQIWQGVISGITFSKSTYLQPRYVAPTTWIQLDPADVADICPGY